MDAGASIKSMCVAAEELLRDPEQRARLSKQALTSASGARFVRLNVHVMIPDEEEAMLAFADAFADAFARLP